MPSENVIYVFWNSWRTFRLQETLPGQQKTLIKTWKFLIFPFLDLKHWIFDPFLSIFATLKLSFRFYGFSVWRLLKINLFFNCFPVSERREWRWETKMTFPLPTRNCWADSSSKIALTHISHFFYICTVFLSRLLVSRCRRHGVICLSSKLTWNVLYLYSTRTPVRYGSGF